MTQRMKVNFHRKETVDGVDVWAIDENDFREKLKSNNVIENPDTSLIARNGFIDRTSDMIENVIGVKRSLGLRPIPVDVVPILVREAPEIPTAN